MPLVTTSRTSVASTKPRSSEMSSGPGFRIRRNFERPSPDLIALFRDFETPDISDILNRMYTMVPEIKNLINDQPLVGPALTVKVFPGDNLMVHKALDVAKPGDVVVIDTSGSPRNAVMGDLVATKAKHRGIAGFIVDGLIRDLPAMQEVGLPVYARGITPFGPLHRGPGELGYSVSCGSIVVNPGDIVVADACGVAVVRREFAEDIIKRLHSHRAKLEAYIANVKAGRFSNAWVDDILAAENCMIE